MRPEHPDCPCPVCAQFRHGQDVDGVLLVGLGVVVALVGLVWLAGQVGGPAGGGQVAGGAAGRAAWHSHPTAQASGRSRGGVASGGARAASRPGRHVRRPGTPVRRARAAWDAGGLVAPPTHHGTLASHAPPRSPTR
jgi:hypothetical protein